MLTPSSTKQYSGKFYPLFQKVLQYNKSRLDEDEINDIFGYFILPILKKHAINYEDLGFGTMTTKVFPKEEVLIELGILKYIFSIYNKEPQKPYEGREKYRYG